MNRLWTLMILTLIALAAGVSVADAQVIYRTSGTITTNGADCSVATNCVQLRADKTGSGSIVLSGTWTGTMQFEGTADGGTTWFALKVLPNGGTSYVTSATANGQWIVPMPLTDVRVRSSAAMTGSVSVALLMTSARPFGPPTLPALAAASCTTIANPVAGQECLDTTRGVWLSYDGTGWQSDAALATNTVIVTDPKWTTGGSGTSASPWTGWDTAITWSPFTQYIFPAGFYSYATSPAWAQHGIVLQGFGRAVLKFTGTGIAADLTSASIVTNVRMENLVLVGNANATIILHLNNIERSLFRNLVMWSSTDSCVVTDIAIANVYDHLTCSTNVLGSLGLAGTPVPVTGLKIGRSGASTASTVLRPVLEGVSGSGLWLQANAATISVIGGTSEGNNRGVQVDAGATWNTFTSLDLESNTTEDILDAGQGDSYISVLSATKAHITGSLHELQGGSYNQITIDAGAQGNTLTGVRYNSAGTGGVTDNGNNTSWRNLLNGSSNVFASDKIGGGPNAGGTTRLVPSGTTSFSLRNNADNADNLLITDAGNVTVRNNLIASGTLTQSLDKGLTVVNGPIQLRQSSGTAITGPGLQGTTGGQLALYGGAVTGITLNDSSASFTRWTMDDAGGLWSSGATGSGKGAGTINIATADGYFVNNTALKNIAETLSNKTVAAPVLSGTATGTYTLGGTPTLGASLALNGQTLSGNATLTGTLTGGTFSGPTVSGTIAGPLIASTPQITAGSGTGFTVNNAGEVRRETAKYTATNATFSAAAKTADFTIATLPAKAKLVGIVEDVTTTFSGGGETAATMTCGKTLGGAEYLVSFSVFTAVITRGLADADLGTSINRANAVQGGDTPSWSGTTAITCRLTTTTNNTSGLTQGSATWYVTTETMP